jgi:CRISPR-associated endonuclease Cas2
MALYLLSYDITEKNHDYQSLWDWLNQLGAVRLLYSEWAVPWANNSSALELTNVALKHVMQGDNIFVCELYDNNYSIAWRTLRISDDTFRALLTQYALTKK